jgi:hypothetical protein
LDAVVVEHCLLDFSSSHTPTMVAFLQSGFVVEGAFGSLEAPTTNPDGLIGKRRKRGRFDDGVERICFSTKLRFVEDPRYQQGTEQQQATIINSVAERNNAQQVYDQDNQNSADANNKKSRRNYF